jgi:SsrA-binding protein
MGNNRIVAKNRKANFDYTILENYQSGIVLNGCEIKSIRLGKVNFTDSYCFFDNGELYIKNLYINEYDNSGYIKLEPNRDRKLLLTKRELKKLTEKIKVSGHSIVPVKLYINEHGYAKVDIALVKGKKTYDKSQTIKERDLKREFERSLK